MKCSELECKGVVEWACLGHHLTLCNFHYKKHCRLCEYFGIPIEDVQQSIANHTNTLNKRFSEIRKQIKIVSKEIVRKIEISVENTINSLEKQKNVLLNLILRMMPEAEIKRLLQCFPDSIKIPNSYDEILGLEEKFRFSEFQWRIQEIQKELEPNTQINPVPSRLDDMNLAERKKWCQSQGLDLYNLLDTNTIKISKDSKYILICNIQLGKAYLGKIYKVSTEKCKKILKIAMH